MFSLVPPAMLFGNSRYAFEKPVLAGLFSVMEPPGSPAVFFCCQMVRGLSLGYSSLLAGGVPGGCRLVRLAGGPGCSIGPRFFCLFTNQSYCGGSPLE